MPEVTGTIDMGYSPSAMRQAAEDAVRLSKGMGDLAQDLKRLAGEGEGADRSMAKTAEGLHYVTEISSKAKGAVSDLWGAVGQAVGVSSAYEKTLAQVSTLSDEAAGKQDHYRQEILRVSTALGTDAVQSANALYDALSSGIPADNAVSFMETASKAAVAGATTTEASVRGITTALNAWKLDASEAGAVSDTFFQGVNVGVFRFEELSNSIGQVAPLAASMGISYKEVTAATASLTKQGLSASEAITQQRASIAAILTPNKQMSQVLQQLALDNTDVAKTAQDQGISIGEAAVRTLGYQGTMEALRDSSKNAGVELATATGSVQALGAVLGLTGENAAGARADLDTMTNSAGSTNRAFAIMEETFDGTQAKLEAVKQRGMIELGGAIQSALLPMLQAAINLLGPLVEWFSKWGEGGKAGAGAAILLAGGIGTLVTSLVLGKAAMDALHIKATLTTAGLVGLQGALVATGFGALVVAVGLLVAGMHDLSDSYAKQFKKVQEAEGGLDSYIASVSRAQQETTGLGKIVATMSGDGFGEGKTRKAGEAWLQYGLGVDKAVLSSQAFQQASAALAIEASDQGLRKATITTAEYEARLLAAADAASVAAGKGHVLSESQQKQADAWTKSKASLALYQAGISKATIESDEFQAQSRIFAAAIQAEGMSAAEAERRLFAFGQQLDANTARAAASAKQMAEAAGVVQTYGSSFETLLRAGSQWTDDAEAMAAAQEKADSAMATSVQQTLGSIWTARKEHSVKMAEAERADSEARARALQSQGGGGGEKAALNELKFADKMADLADRAGRAKNEVQQAAVARDIEIARAAHNIQLADQQKHEGQMVGAVTGGGRAKAVQDEYDKELAAAKESLAQTVVEYVKTQVLLGQTSEETARAIFGKLKGSFQGIEIINPVEEAALGVMAAVHDAAAGVEGGLDRIVPAIDNVVGTMEGFNARDAELTSAVQGNAADRTAALAGEADAAGTVAAGHVEADSVALGSAQLRHQEVTGAMQGEILARNDGASIAAATAAQHLAADDAVKLAAALRMQAAGESLSAEQQALIATANVARIEGGKAGAAMIGVGTDTKTGAGGVAVGTGIMKAEIGSVPGAVTKAATEVRVAAEGFGGAFAAAGDKAKSASRETMLALEGTLAAQKSGMDETTRAGLTGEESHGKIATGARTSKEAVTEYGAAAKTQYEQAARAGKEDQEQVDRLAASLRNVPRDTKTQIALAGVEKFRADVAQIIADLRNIPQTLTTRVQAVYVPGSPSMAEGHSLRLQHDLEDIYAVVDTKGPLIFTTQYDPKHDAVMVDSGGVMGAEKALASAVDYAASNPVKVQFDVADDGAVKDGKLPWQLAVEAYYAKLAEAPVEVEKFLDIVERAMGGGGNWEQIVAEWSNTAINGWLDVSQAVGEGKNVQLPDYRKLTGDPAVAKGEWDRFWTDVARQEEERARHANEHFTRQSRRFDQGGNETMSEKIEEQWDLEKQRHEAVMNMIEQERIASDRYFERNGDYYKELAELRKLAEDAIKAEQKAYVDAEKEAHKLVTEQIEDEVKRRKRLHDDVLTDIEERKRVEAEAYQASQAALDEQARQIKAEEEARSKALAAVKRDIEDRKADIDVEGAKRKLADLRSEAEAFGDALGKLEESGKIEEDQRKRAKERVKLHTDAQREMLARFRDTLAGEDRRTADLLLAGYEVRGSDADRIMAQIQAGLDDQVAAQEGVVSAHQREIEALNEQVRVAEQKAKVEKEASDEQLKVLEELKRQNTAAHNEYVRQIEAEKRVEDTRYKAESQAIADLKESEKDRHEARLAQLNAEYALELLRLGKTEEEVNHILAAQEAQADRVAKAAQARYDAAVAAVDAETKRLTGEAEAREQELRLRAEAMRLELINRLRTIAATIGGEAAAAVIAMLDKLLGEDPNTGIFFWKRYADAAKEATSVIIGQYGAIGDAVSGVTHLIEEQNRAADPARKRYKLPKERLNASTRRGRGGFRAGHDWEAWHGIPIEDSKLTTPPDEFGLWGGEKAGGAPPASGGGPQPDDPRIGPTDPWEPIKSGAKDAGDAVVRGFIDPVVSGLTEMRALLRDIAADVGSLPPSGDIPLPWRYSEPPRGDEPNPWRYSQPPGGGAPVTYNQYGDVNSFDATDAPAEFVDALLGVVGMSIP